MSAGNYKAMLFNQAAIKLSTRCFSYCKIVLRNMDGCTKSVLYLQYYRWLVVSWKMVYSLSFVALLQCNFLSHWLDPAEDSKSSSDEACAGWLRSASWWYLAQKVWRGYLPFLEQHQRYFYKHPFMSFWIQLLWPKSAAEISRLSNVFHSERAWS